MKCNLARASEPGKSDASNASKGDLGDRIVALLEANPPPRRAAKREDPEETLHRIREHTAGSMATAEQVEPIAALLRWHNTGDREQPPPGIAPDDLRAAAEMLTMISHALTDPTEARWERIRRWRANTAGLGDQARRCAVLQQVSLAMDLWRDGYQDDAVGVLRLLPASTGTPAFATLTAERLREVLETRDSRAGAVAVAAKLSCECGAFCDDAEKPARKRFDQAAREA